MAYKKAKGSTMLMTRKALVYLPLILLSTSVSQALPICKNMFLQKNEISAVVNQDPVKQWLTWEQKSNFGIFRKSGDPIAVQNISVPKSAVTTTFLQSASKDLRALIAHDNVVSWFKHPYNTFDSLPYFNETSKKTVQTYFTASRSLALILGEQVYTLKMGTDHPHGPKGEYQYAKAFTKEDITDGINRMTYVEKVDSAIGQDPTLILAKEVAMVAEKKSGEGYLFRDISFMNDGNYYLPALSIPYAGREIAKLNQQEPDAFWQEHYATLLGKAKAKLLLRYGLQMETPNSQNMLIQLDLNLKPTGVIVFRDISDTILINAVAEGLGETKTLQKDKELGVENGDQIQPFWSNSAWRFDEAGENSFSSRTLSTWGRAHDRAYLQEIEKALGLDLSQFQRIDNNPAFDTFMSSEIVKQKLKAYRASQTRNQKFADKKTAA